MPRISVLALMMAVFFSPSAQACDASLRWENIRVVSLSVDRDGKSSKVSLTRYLGGDLFARVEEAGNVKEMYQLARGPLLFRGVSEKEMATPSIPFFMLDLPVGIAVRAVARYFPRPCAVPEVKTDYEYQPPRGDDIDKVKGHVIRHGSVIAYDLLLTQDRPQGVALRMMGSIDLSPLARLADDTDVVGWIAKNGLGPDAEIKPVQAGGDILTIAQARKAFLRP